MEMVTYTEQGKDKNDCMRKIHARFGDRPVQVFEQRRITIGGFMGLFPHEGVEIKFYLPNDLGLNFFNRRAAQPKKQTAQDLLLPGASAAYGKTSNLSALNAEAAALNSLLGAKPSGNRPSAGGPALSGEEFEEQKRRLISAAGKDPTLIQVLNEVRDIKEKLNSDTAADPFEHPSLARIAEILHANDFSPSFCERILERARRELSLEVLDDYDEVQSLVLDWIGDQIHIWEEGGFQRRPRIVVLVGSTGVGKTSTLAKLAAFYGTDRGGKKPQSLRIITIDAFKIGAKEQIETFGNVMRIPVEMVDNYDALRKAVALCMDDTDMILVDTIGKSPRDPAKLGEMQEILSACGPHVEVHLVLAATTKTSDIENIIQQFEPFNFQAVIVTKLDETFRLGNVISALADKGKSISYVAAGQKVPRDIQFAQVQQFLCCLDDFKVDRARVDKRFPVDESKVIRWR